MKRSSGLSWNFSMMICSTIIIILLSLSLQKVMCVDRCLRDQQSLLLQLNSSLIFGESDGLGWNRNTDCCTWEGVSCQEGRVIGLHLRNKSIIGGLTDNSSLFRFHHLRSLDLSFNFFYGHPIPSRFGNLTSLTHLNLSYSDWVGHIPIEMSRLTNLVSLDLSTWWSLLKVDHSNWSMLFRNLTKLQQLYLDGVNMSATGKEWSRVFSSSVLPNLQELSLRDCSLSGPIHPSLLTLQSLSVIRLDENNLSAPFPSFITNSSKLTSLHLKSCGLYGTFPKEIFQVPTLETIDLSSNELLHGSLPEFSLNNSLRNLVLISTRFSGRLPASIRNLTELSTLALSYCNFNETLPNFLLPKLVYLDLSYNTFNGPIPSFIFSKNLETIILSNNNFSGPIPPAHWEGLLKLLKVDLGHNFFNGTLPTSLFRVPSLEHIDLSYNQFTAQIPEFQHVSSSMVDTLDLSSNNLEGPVPMSVFQLKNLSHLSLSFNKLNGTVQLDVVKGLVKLTHLDLSHSNLLVTASANATAWSSFPKGIQELHLASCKLNVFPNLQNQSSLTSLDLSNNQMHGEVPNWIWESDWLWYLNLSYNYLVGIQEPYAIPTNIEILDLHYNQLSGKIPTPPKDIYFIDFSNNNLGGVLPKSICNMPLLFVLDLSSNNLSGTIPDCLSALGSLQVLNLRGNRVSGVIPASFPDDCPLSFLDLNANSIQGQIPKSLAYCNELEVLDLGSNSLIDEFPCFLKNISALRVLNLRSNKFHGSIGCPNANETWEKLQIIDLAHNSFSGELPGHNFTNWKAMMPGENNAQRKLNNLQLQVVFPFRVSTTVTIKGRSTVLVKILTLEICIDFSSNNFSGQIPQEFGALGLLYALNLSNNAFSGPIPWSLGELQSLESLDLSRNKLSGTIPASLANLNFLSYLDVSFNKLVGMIPSGRQFQTFSDNFFQGNQGLCGFPLTTNCKGGGALDHTTPAEDNHSDSSETKIDWNLLSIEIGFIFGFGSIIGPLVFSKRWRKLYFETMEDAAYRILPLSVTRKWLSWTTAR